MHKLKSSFLIAIMMVAAVGQTATEMESPQINRIAAKLKCSCGCGLDMACQMPPGCPICKANKSKMVNMQKSGMSDQQILDQYVAENGKAILVIPPGLAGVLGPYVALSLGLGLVLLTIRRLMRPRMAAPNGPPIDPETLARIEKDTANID